MAISIQQTAMITPLVNNRVRKKEEQASQYGNHSGDGNTAEKNLQNNAGGDNAKNAFDTGLSFLMKATLPDAPENTVLTGIAEMNAIGLQFFLAMQRQIVHLRLSDISSGNYPAETGN